MSKCYTDGDLNRNTGAISDTIVSADHYSIVESGDRDW